MRFGMPVYAVVGCVALAAASLLAAADPVYDAWAWLVWGRELTHGGLDLSSGPSWKPLAVAITSVLSLFGDAAPSLWLVLVRAAWLLAIVLAARLAWLLTAPRERHARIASAAFAALSLLLMLDYDTSWLRQGASGMSEPLLVAIVLGAVHAGVVARTRAALVLATLAALLRPEIWPLLALYGLWCWRREPSTRPLLVAFALAVPALWLGPELLTEGNALSGAERAQRGDDGPLRAVAEVAEGVGTLPLLAAWPLAILAAVTSDRRARVLLAGALAWIAIVALMAAAAGFAGLPRFMAPAAAVVGVLGGVGLARLLALAGPAWRAHGLRPTVVTYALAALLVTLAVQVALRTEQTRQAAQATARIGHSHDRLRALVRTVGREQLLRCGDLATSDVLVRTALAWELDAALADVVSFGRLPRMSGAFVVGPQAPPGLKQSLQGRADLRGRRGEWSVYSLDCPATAGSRSSAPDSSLRAGVSGARR